MIGLRRERGGGERGGLGPLFRRTDLPPRSPFSEYKLSNIIKAWAAEGAGNE